MRRSTSATTPVALLAAALCACSGAPSLTITAPLANDQLKPGDDVDPLTPGLQIAVDATTSAADGSEATAFAGEGPIARATVQAGKVRFPSVTLADGQISLAVGVVDRDNNRAALTRLALHADTLERGCRFLSPKDGSVITSDPGDSGLVNVPVTVLCRGLEPNGNASLYLDQDPQPLQQPLGADGTVTFRADLLPGQNRLAAQAKGTDFAFLRIELRPPIQRCRTELSPGSGTLFNAAGDKGGSGSGAAVADRDPAAPGEQARLTVASDCADGTPVLLSATRLGLPAFSLTQLLQNGHASFDATLPEGPLLLQAFAGGAGSSGASRRVSYTVDSIVPRLAILTPAAHQLLGDADDSLPAPGMQVNISGIVSGLEVPVVYLEIDQFGQFGAAGRELQVPVTSAGSFSAEVTLENGSHTVRALAFRQSGNVGQSATVPFDTVFFGAGLAFVTPQAGDRLGLDKLVPGAGGASINFQLHAAGLAGGTAVVRCGTAQGSATIGTSGDVTVPVFVAFPSCGPQAFSCTGTASTGAPGSTQFSAGSIALSADATAPTLTWTSPLSGSTRNASVDVQAVTGSCPGETQGYVLTLGGQSVATGIVTANSIDRSGAQAIALQPGDNVLALAISDDAGNTTSLSRTVTLLTGTPHPQITAPAAAATITSANDVDKDLSNGLQIPVLVEVPDRPAGAIVVVTVSSAEAGSSVRAPQSGPTVLVGGHKLLQLPAVGVPEGHVTITACVTDPVSPPVPAVCTSVTVTVAAGRPICNLIAPADGAQLDASSDARADLPGYQTTVRVQTSGNGAIDLTASSQKGGTTVRRSLPAPGGSGLRTAIFTDVTLDKDGGWRLDAACASTSAGQGRALTNQLTLSTQGGPLVSFTSPASGAVLALTDFDGAGNTPVQVQASGGGVPGGSVTLSADCGAGAQSVVQPIPAGGLVVFAVPLLAPGQEGSCTLTAQGSSGAVPGLPASITVTVDRSAPAPVFATPVDQGRYPPAAPELDCTTPSLPALHAVGITIADAVSASSLRLTVNGLLFGGAASVISGGFAFSNVPILNGANTASVTAADAAGNPGSAAITFQARCTPSNVTLNLGSTRLGYAQDQDHLAAGEQAAVVINASVQNGSTLQLCSTIDTGAGGTCAAGPTYFPVALPAPAPTIQGGSASFAVTLSDGAQTLVAEVTDPAGTDVSPARSAIVRATPPRVIGLTIAENDGDLSLNQAEFAATLHFAAATIGATAGQLLEIHSAASPGTILGSATVLANGTASVPVLLASLAGAGGYQSHVFYAQVSDDANNRDSIPGNEYPGDPTFTLGSTGAPFVIAPAPSLALTRPAAGTAKLLAADDSRCAGTCPGTDPLRYLLSATSSAPDGSTVTFLLDGAALGADVSLSGGAIANLARDLANGAARAVAVRVVDPYGNPVTTAARTLLIDSVPPALTLTAPAPDSTLTTYPSTFTVATGATLEAGQLISITSDLDNFAGSAAAAGSSTNVSVSLPSNGVHHLVATASDTAGNPGTSASLTVTQSFFGPTVTLTQPAQASKVWFGTATQSGGRCAPPLVASTTNTPDGTPVTIWVVSSADCSGAPSAGAQIVGASSGSATFTDLLTFAGGDTGFLCERVVVNSQTANSQPQSFECDLAAPQISFTAPAAGQLYLAPAPVLPGGAIANQGTAPDTLLADFTVSLTARAGSTVQLFADGGGTAIASQTLPGDLAAQPLLFSSAPLTIALPQTATTLHSLSAKVTAPSGNSASSASLSIDVDVAPPGEALPAFSKQNNLSGVFHVSIPTVPGDDGASGPVPPAWEVRYSLSTPLTAANWSSAGVKIATNLGGSLPAPPAAAFDLALPTDQGIWVGVRAVDRKGNLGAFTDQTSTPTLSTQLARLDPLAGIDVPNSNSNAPPAMRVADLDGDGFDDVILAYPFDGACAGGFCDGRIYVYFGAAGGFAGTAPMVLSGSIGGGILGNLFGKGFEVADVDGDGLADVLASETDCAPGSAFLNLWTGAAIKAARQGGTPAVVKLTSGTDLLGGSVRAVGHATGGAGAGQDLLVTSYTAGCGSPQTMAAVLLPRGGAWTTGSSSLLNTAGSVTVTLPALHESGTLEAAPLDLLDLSGRSSLFLSFIDTDPADGAIRELRALSGLSLLPDSTVAIGSGQALAAPLGSSAFFGFALGGGRDAIGDAKTDLVISDKDQGKVYLYDGSSLLSPGATAATLLDPSGETAPPAPAGDAGSCALLLPDLDGDGKAEFSGCADTGKLPAAYLIFGGSGPSLAFFNPNPPTWRFLPNRGQRVGSSLQNFGQAVGAGHVTAKTGNVDLVVLSHGTSGRDHLTLLK